MCMNLEITGINMMPWKIQESDTREILKRYGTGENPQQKISISSDSITHFQQQKYETIKQSNHLTAKPFTAEKADTTVTV